MLEGLRKRHPGTAIVDLLLYELGRWLVLIVLVLFLRLRVFGAGRVPAAGPVLLVANHQSHLDPPALGVAVFQRHLDFIARIGLFRRRWFGGLLARLHAIPIREEGSDTAAIREVLRRLGQGRAVLIFPEGTRSPDGSMQPFKRGVAVLVKRAGCPVVPAAVEGGFDAWPRDRLLPRLFGRRMAVMYGEPIPHEELMREPGGAALGRLEREIDAMRLELRERLRRASRGRYPQAGPGDRPFSQAAPGPGPDPGSADASRTGAAPSCPSSVRQ